MAAWGLSKQLAMVLGILGLMMSLAYAEPKSLVPLPPLPPTSVTEKQTSDHEAKQTVSKGRHLKTAMLTQAAPVPQPVHVATPADTSVVSPPVPPVPQNPLPGSQAEGFAQPAVETVPVMTEEPSLDELYKQREERYGEYTSAGYLFRVFGILALLLVGFYGVARYVLPKWLTNKGSDPLIPFSSSPQSTVDGNEKPVKKPLLQAILPTKTLWQESGLQPQVLSRTRLSPTKEIHVVQVGDRRLVVGSTAQQMTLLAELPVEAPTVAENKEAAPQRAVISDTEMRHIYQKYLSPANGSGKGQTENKVPKPQTIPQEEEVYLLDDYEDEFERLS